MSLQVFIQLGTWILRIRQTTKGRTTTIKKKKKFFATFSARQWHSIVIFRSLRSRPSTSTSHILHCALVKIFTAGLQQPSTIQLVRAAPWLACVPLSDGSRDGRRLARERGKTGEAVEVRWGGCMDFFFFLYHKFLLVFCNMYMGYDKHVRWDRAYPEVCPCHPISYCSWKKKKKRRKKENK